MMNATPPIKPPRGIKATKETSGLLISVIRALSASETNEQREVEKAKLEKEYKRSDQRLDELVSLHDQDLANVMQIFGALSEKVTATRERIHTVKENLNACKQLLRCKREELMKLWLEGVEHKHVLHLLNDVETLREIPLRLTQYIDKKLYLHATQLLVSALSMGDGGLQKVEGLREVRSEIHLKQHSLQTKLLQELSKYLYIDSTKELSLKRHGSNRDFQRGNELRSSRQNKGKRNLTDSVPVPRTAIDVSVNNIADIIEDEDSNNIEVNSEHFLAIIIECLALLNKIPETIEAIKAQMQSELLRIITNTTKEIKKFSQEGSDSTSISIVIDAAQFNTVQCTEGQTLLLVLLQHIFRQFRSIVVAHQVALRNFMHVVKKYNINVRLYEMLDVWSKIQTVLQLLLTEYLDIHNIVDGVLRTSSNLNDSAKDINAFFTKKKLQKQKNNPLFRFDSSSHPMTLNNYFKDHAYNSLMTESGQIVKEKTLLCEPDPRNIIFIFRPMMDFIDEIEKLIGCTSRNPCTLNSFITDYVKEVYLGMHHMLVATTIDSAIKNPDAWRALTTAEIMKEFNLTRPLLHSTVMVQKCVAELRLLMIALPLQGEHFCTLILNILHNYRETCQAAYRAIVQADERNEERRIRSAMWLKDDDISRFIKSLPNWASLKHKNAYAHAHSGGNVRRLPVRQETQDEESPEDVRQRNLKEAEILASNLGEGGISANEILSDINQLKCLALLQESMEWFAFSQRSFLDELYQANATEHRVPLPAMPDALVKSLNQVNHEFEELSDMCILLLHLEVRVQCFHYLLPQGEYSNLCGGLCDTQEADSRVEELSRVLQHIDESLQAILDARKTKYIFEGLGHLVAKILITSAQYIRKIDENGIQKMCRNIFTLQQTLTNITMARELALDYARQYFELFYETPDAILNNVLENGAKFSEIEYINAFQLISRSQTEYSSISKHLEKLSEILGDVGVIV